jgi:hypothetical protein
MMQHISRIGSSVSILTLLPCYVFICQLFHRNLSANWLFAVIVKLEAIYFHVESVYGFQNHVQFSITVFLCLLSRWS